jgi:transposase
VLGFFQSVAPCLVGMEACATAHHWVRELAGLRHTVKLMPPAYVKAYVKRNKNDTADAEAICEAVIRPTMCRTARRRWAPSSAATPTGSARGS